jgi:hypothetical protein
MLTTVEGIDRDGRIELKSLSTNITQEAKVIVTFIDLEPVNLADRGIGRLQAQALRDSLTTFASDWDSPEMSIYDTPSWISRKVYPILSASKTNVSTIVLSF